MLFQKGLSNYVNFVDANNNMLLVESKEWAKFGDVICKEIRITVAKARLGVVLELCSRRR